MPIVCINRPNRKRKRTYTAKDCGRIVCRAIETGAEPAEIEREIGICLGDVCQRVRVSQFLDLVAEATVAISIGLTVAQFLLVSLRFAVVIARRIPLLRGSLTRAEQALARISAAQDSTKLLTREAELLRARLDIIPRG